MCERGVGWRPLSTLFQEGFPVTRLLFAPSPPPFFSFLNVQPLASGQAGGSLCFLCGDQVVQRVHQALGYPQLTSGKASTAKVLSSYLGTFGK